MVTERVGLLTIQEMHDTGAVTERQMERAFLAKMASEMQAIRKFLSVEQLDIDEWKWEQLATTFQPLRDFDGPIVITSILAVFPIASTSVTINLGTPGRTIPVQNLAAGMFAVDDLRIQCGQDDITRNMVIAPAGTGYINFFGYADKKVIDKT
jgi:hypothetical protein